MSSSPLLRLRSIHKSFGPVRALRGVDLDVSAGEVLGLIGENGAGKSTLMKILSGVHRPDSGEIELAGRSYSPQSPLEGRRAGIAMIYQELNLAPHLSVEANVVLGLERSRGGWLKSSADSVRDALVRLGHPDIPLDAPVHTLGLAERQVVEIARALVSDARVVIMDEPTSSLTGRDAEILFGVVRRLKDQGVAVVYISHFLEEVTAVCDRFLVLRDGASVATGAVSDYSIEQLVEFMIGRPAGALYPGPPEDVGDEVLRVESLTGTRGRPDAISFTVGQSEILGLFGLVGAGRSETVRSLFGLHSAVEGSVTLAGRPSLEAEWLTPPRALERGLDLLSEDRKTEGLAGRMSVVHNLTLSAIGTYSRFGWIDLGRERAGGATWLKRLGVRLHSGEQPADTLSGGNQQKLCLARMLHHDSDILFLDEPTRGVDVGSKAEIYRLIRDLAERGKTIVMISSYLPELLGMCHNIGVLYRGGLSGPRPVDDWTEVEIMTHATSGAADA